MSEPVFTKHADGGDLFMGWTGRECDEHRTVGSHRAWCYDCGEWCYPRAGHGCKGCHLPALEAEAARLRAALRVIQGWDMLNPPQTQTVADLGWLRGVVDDALGDDL